MNQQIVFSIMAIMDYSSFKEIFNETIFDKSKADLISKIAEYPNRYIGLFRPTKPKAKILQNLLQSHEIRFGDAFERIIERYLSLKNCHLLEKRYTNSENETLSIDQCFEKNGKVYFIEQKVRDDHDSTKKRGQINNFEKKLYLLQNEYTDRYVIGIFYFIDPDLMKNKNYYEEQLHKMSGDYDVDLHLFYGQPLFDYLGYPDVWIEILSYLEHWKAEIPDFPEINFDLDATHTFEEIKDLKPPIFRKLFDNEQVFDEILLTLFPHKQTLRLLYGYFLSKDKPIYKNLATKLSRKINL